MKRVPLKKRIIRFIKGFFNLGVPLKVVLILCIVLTGSAIFITYTRTVEKTGGKDEFEEAQYYIGIKDLICENYIGEVERDKLAGYSSAAMVSGLNDKWSYYMTPEEYSSYNMYSTEEYSDIGFSIIKNDSGIFQVIDVSSGSAADIAGVTVGISILSIDDVDISSMNIDEVRNLIRAKMNSKFSLGIGGNNVIEVDCSDTYESSVTFRLEKTMAGYLQIKDFDAGTADDSISAIKTLLEQNAEAFVIDLRGNSGGLYSEAVTLLDFLLPKLDVFVEVDNKGHEEVFTSDGVCLEVPMCVMVNSGTYGCAELFAKVLQEYTWATVLGEQTSGDVEIQETFELSDGAAIRLSTKKYLTGLRTDISNIGVVPDIITYNSDESATGTTQGTLSGDEGTASTSNDEQLMQALRLLS